MICKECEKAEVQDEYSICAQCQREIDRIEAHEKEYYEMAYGTGDLNGN